MNNNTNLFFLLGFFIFFLPSCNVNYKLLKNREVTVLYHFELIDLGDGDPYYFLKYSSCLIEQGVYDLKSGTYIQNPESYALLEFLPDTSMLASELASKLNKKYSTNHNENTPSSTPLFSKRIGESGFHYSDHIYTYAFIPGEVYIVFKIKGDIALIKNISDDAILSYNKNYACSISPNNLQLPFCKIVTIKGSSPIPDAWGAYFKMPIDSFRINNCYQ